MQTKNLNETKIYDNLKQAEKAKLMFKAMKNEDGNTFDKLISSGESERWIVRNHGAREMLGTLTDVALCWGVEYWRNQALMVGNLALSKSEDNEDQLESLQTFKSLQILNEAYLVTLDRLEADYGLDKETVFNLAKVSPDVSAYGDFKTEIMPDHQELFDSTVDELHSRFSKLINQVLETIGND